MKLETREDYLSQDEGKLLLRIARYALNTRVTERRDPTLEGFALTPSLQAKHGAFVTLRKQGELRGCIGYTANYLPLAQTVMENAQNAACSDPRFEPVTPEELSQISIEVSALTPGDTPETPFKKVKEVSEIIIGRDGLFIERPPQRGGLLLPQVAVEYAWDVPQFLSAVCQKAGYNDGAWKEAGVNLYRFSAQVFEEESN